MKRFLLACTTALAALATVAPAAHATDIGVSVEVGQPGFYGRIDIGSAPRPVLVYPEPIIVQPAPIAVVRQPIYLRVPPGHAKNWAKHCGRYSACGQPVYFVQDHWYEEVYVPRYRQREYRHREYRRDDRRSHEHRAQRDRRDDRRGHGHPGNGRGKHRD